MDSTSPRPPFVWLVTAGFFHPSWQARGRLAQMLKGAAGLEFRQAASLEQAELDIATARAVVLFVHQQEISAQTLHAFDRFVRSGGGLLGIHSATASFKEDRPFFEILGGRFTGHGPVQSFELRPVEGDDNPFAGLPAFTLTDELYLHELQPGIQPRFVSEHAGQIVPVVWTYRYGAGRVCYAGPGHRAASFAHPVFQEILRRGLAWVCAP